MTHKLQVLGPPQVLDDTGVPASLSLGKPLAVLIYVACSPSPVSRDDLADLLWPDADRQKGRHSVRQALWVLKNALGDEIFSSHDPLSLKDGTVAVDLSAFSEALLQGRVEEARELWRGPVLEHFVLAGVRHWNHWAEDLRGDLEHRFCKALLRHAQNQAAEGDTAAACSALDQAIEVAPASEAPHLARIELLLDLLRLDAAREAIADAHQTLGDQADSVARLNAMEERLQQVIQEQRARVEEGETFPMEFVGRSRELAGLQALWRDAEIGLTRVAVVTGPSGIGKTRLAQELMAYVSGNEIRAVALKGTRAGMKLRWGSASDMVRELLRQPGSAGISSASDSLLRAMLPSMGTRAVDLQMVNGMSPAAILDAVTDLMESVTFEAPLVVLVDDFQWMDPESRTLFLGLANRCRELRVLFLILGRSDLSSRHWEEVEQSLVAEAGARSFHLKPLIEEEVGELLALGAAFPDPQDAPGAVSRIHQASAGNPLFILEILKELHEKEILVREGPGWVFQTSQIPESFELPENIRLLLKERLDRLSEAASNLAATLGKGNRKTAPELLQKDTQLPHGVFTQAVAELLDRGVIEWVDGTSLDFVHDLLRETAASHLSGSLPESATGRTWFARNWWKMVAGLVLTLLATGWALETQGLGPWNLPADPPPYGGGTIILVRGTNPPRALRIPEDPIEEVEWFQLDPAPPEGTRWVYRAPGSGYLWFGLDEPEAGTDITQIHANGIRTPLFPWPGDQTLRDVSPEGGRILFTSENVGGPVDEEGFSASLFWGELSGLGEAHLIYRAQGPIGTSRWSGDGEMVAFTVVDASDSLAVYSLAGERLYAKGFGDIRSLDWCGNDILVTGHQEGSLELFRVSLRPEEVTNLGPLVLGRRLACSPDGTTLLQVEVVAGRPAFILRDLESGTVVPLPDADVQDHSPFWIPDNLTTVPLAVEATPDTVRLLWGDTITPAASIRFSDQSRTTEGVWWESLGPEIANINPEGQLTGNQVGLTHVLARWRHSLRDTVVVVVDEGSGSGAPTLIFNDPWEQIDSTRWLPFGSNPPITRTLDEGPVLQLRGTEKYSDGLLYWDPIPLGLGVTVELEFKMELTRELHQNLSLCLKDMDVEAARFGRNARWGAGGEMCFLYPSGEMMKLNPSEVSLIVSPGFEASAEVATALPTDGWTHVAIQVRADGEPSIVVNRERVATSGLLLQTTPIGQWTVKLEGDAVGTELFVRNLNIWQGVRY